MSSAESKVFRLEKPTNDTGMSGSDKVSDGPVEIFSLSTGFSTGLAVDRRKYNKEYRYRLLFLIKLFSTSSGVQRVTDRLELSSLAASHRWRGLQVSRPRDTRTSSAISSRAPRLSPRPAQASCKTVPGPLG